jgi:hypothetical protein
MGGGGAVSQTQLPERTGQEQMCVPDLSLPAEYVCA